MLRHERQHTATRVLFVVVIALLATLTIRSLWSAAVPSYTPLGPGDVYLALGDSLAWGAFLEQPETQSYPALLHARLAAGHPIAFANLAVPGETSASFLRRQLPRAIALIEREQADGRRVSPITLDIGGNDLRNAERGTPAERAAVVQEVQRNLARTLDALQRATGGRADIAVMTYYNPYGGDPNEENSEAYWVTQLNAAIRTEAEQRGIAVADTYAPFDNGRAYSYTNVLLGDVHATRQGHAVIAEQFWAALEYDG